MEPGKHQGSYRQSQDFSSTTFFVFQGLQSEISLRKQYLHYLSNSKKVFKLKKQNGSRCEDWTLSALKGYDDKDIAFLIKTVFFSYEYMINLKNKS